MTPLESLAQLVERCEHAPILEGKEGMRGPLLAEAKAVLKEHGIDSQIPRPGSTYQGWLTFKGAPFCIVAEEKDRPMLTEALGILLRESHKAGYGRPDGAGVEPERGQSGARAGPERSGSGARAGPERSGSGAGAEPPVSRYLRIFDRDITISGPAVSVVAISAVVAWLKSALQAIEPAAPIPDPEEYGQLGPLGGGCTLPKGKPD